MPEFAYIAVDPKGKERRGTVKATTDADARAGLEARKLYVVKVRPQPAAAVTDIAAGRLALTRGKRLSARQLTLFTRQLATLSQVSPLEEALRTIARQSEQDHVRALIAELRQPSEAEMRGKLISALAYPIVLTGVAILVVAALMIAVVPKVVEQFDDVGQQLPLLTRIIIGISTFLASYWWALLLLIGFVAAGGVYALRNEDLRLRFDRAVLRLPLIGRLIRDLHAARMARTLSTMIESRLPLVEGLKLTIGTVQNRALRKATAELVESVRSGGSLSGAMARSAVFPPLLVYLAASGESAGRLDVMLARAADYLEREFDNFTATALSMLEPAIIVVMGAIVTTIVLAILLPILQLEKLVGG